MRDHENKGEVVLIGRVTGANDISTLLWASFVNMALGHSFSTLIFYELMPRSEGVESVTVSASLNWNVNFIMKDKNALSLKDDLFLAPFYFMCIGVWPTRVSVYFMHVVPAEARRRCCHSGTEVTEGRCGNQTNALSRRATVVSMPQTWLFMASKHISWREGSQLPLDLPVVGFHLQSETSWDSECVQSPVYSNSR